VMTRAEVLCYLNLKQKLTCCIAHGNITYQLIDRIIMMILNCKHIFREDYDILCMHWSVKQLCL
jgi:hypothetical protein